MDDQKPAFQMSADARFLIQRLQKLAVGETVTYRDLLDATGRSSLQEIRSALRTARRALEREHKAFGTVIGFGLKRLSDPEVVATSSATARKIRGAARRGVRTLEAVADFSSLPRPDQMRHSASMSIFGAIASLTSETKIARVEQFVDRDLQKLPFNQTLAVFTKGNRDE